MTMNNLMFLRKTKYLITFLYFILYCFPTNAEQSNSTEEEARVSCQRAEFFFNDGNFENALTEFQHCYETGTDYRVLYNIAVCKARLHNYSEAIDILRQYLQSDRSMENEDRQETELWISELQKRVGSVKLNINAEGAQIYIDRNKTGISPLTNPIILNIGTHNLNITKNGYQNYEKTFEVFAETEKQIQINLIKTQNNLPDNEIDRNNSKIITTSNQKIITNEPATPFYRSWWFWTIVGVVAAGATIGTVLYITKPFEEEIDVIDRI